MPSNRSADPAAREGFAESSATPITIRFADVDMMNVAHHSAYVHWFEQVRFHFLTHVAGIGFDEFIESGIAMPVIALDVKYRRSFRFTDRPVGYARVQLFPEARIALQYAIFDAAGGWLGATGTTTHCYVGRDGKLLLRAPGFIQRALERAQPRPHPEATVGA